MDKIVKKSVTALEKKPRGKCRKWRLRVGGKSEKSRRFTGTYTQALEALNTFAEELHKQSVERTFAEHAQDWLRRRRIQGELTGDLAKSTSEKYAANIKMLSKEFGGDLISEVDRDRAEEGLLKIKQSRKNPLSGTYMNQLYTTLKRIFEDAYDRELIEKNPLGKVKAPKKEPSKRRALNREEFVRFVSALNSQPIDAHTLGVRIAVLSGLRRGEIIGLRWCDIDPGVIRVRHSYDEKGEELSSTKTASGVRDVPMASQLEEALKIWRTTQKIKLKHLGIEQTDETPVMTSEVGNVMHPQNFERWWRENRSSYNLDGVVLHELRHTYLTMLASGGAPSSVLKGLAGWATISMADTYVHNDEDAAGTAVKNLDNIIKFGLNDIREKGAI